jgi:hypothetical protein
MLEITTLEQNNVTVSVPYYNYTRNYSLGENSTQRLTVPAEAIQPFAKEISGDLSSLPTNGVYRNGRALEVTAQRPVTISVVSSFRSNSDSYLALPTHVLGDRYSVSTYSTPETEYDFTNNLPAVVSIIAVEDLTVVSFYLNGSSNSETTSETVMGGFASRNLNKGDIWVIASKDINSDIGGSIIKSNKPVAVITGNQCTEVPLGNPFCDFAMNMEIPSHAWGSQYVTIPSPGRKHGNIVRTFPLFDNTSILRNGAVVWNYSEANPELASKPFELPRDYSVTQPVLISSDKRFYAIEHGTGTSEDNRPNIHGGPSTQALMPIGNDVTNAYFTSSSNMGDINSDSYLRIVYRKGDSLGELPFIIQRMPALSTELDLSDNQTVIGNGDIDGTDYGFIIIKLPAGGSFKLSGEGIKSIQKLVNSGRTSSAQPIYLTMETMEALKDTLPPVVEYSQQCDGTIFGFAEDMPKDPAVRSNMGANLMQNDSNFVFVPESRNNVPRKSWTLKPIDGSKDAYAELIFWDMRGNRAIYPIYYSAPKIDVSKEIIDFGRNLFGSELLDTVRVTNLSASVEIEYKSISLANGEHFSIREIDKKPLVNSRLQPGNDLNIEIEHNPTSAGLYLDTLILDKGCGTKVLALIKSLSGNSYINVSDRRLGDIPQDQEKYFDITVQNDSEYELNLFGTYFKKGSPFRITGNSPDINNIWTLPPNTKRTLELSVNTDMAGEYIDTLIVMSDAQEGDSLGIIEVDIKPPGLVVNSYDFGRRAIISNQGEGYVASAGGIRLSNRASRPLTVSDVELPSNSFLLEEDLQGMRIEAGEIIDLPIIFSPETPDRYISTLEITDNLGQSTVSELTGIGTCPSISFDIQTENLTVFGDTLFTSIKINNASLADWEFADSILIEDVYSSDNDIVIDRSNLPIWLYEGGSTEVGIIFYPDTNPGSYDREIVVVRNSCDSDNPVLSGAFVEYNSEISLAGELTTACVNMPAYGSVIIKNLSNHEVDYSGLAFSPALPQFDLLNPLLNSFTLQSKEEIEIGFEFFATTEGDYSTKLVIDEGYDNKLSQNIDIEAESFLRQIYASEDDLSPTVGDTTGQSYMLSSSTGESLAIDKASFILTYDATFMDPVNGSLSLSDELTDAGFSLSNIIYTDGSVSFGIHSDFPAAIANRDIEIVNILYKYYLPNDDSDYKVMLESTFPAGCTNITSRKDSIKLKGCGIDLRQVTSSNFDNNISAFFDGDNVNVSGSVKHGGPLLLEIYDISGSLVGTVFDGKIESGGFDFVFDGFALNSGQYFVSLKTNQLYLNEKVSILR